MKHFQQWLRELGYTEFPDELLLANSDVGTRAYAAEIEEMFASERGINSSAVFCVSEHPTVCLIDGTSLSVDRERRIEQIRQKIWNQNLASVVLVADSVRLLAFSVNDRESEPDILEESEVERYGRWSAHEVHSGFIQDRLPDWFTPEKRVDRRLLTNLRALVKQLSQSGLALHTAEAITAQVIFLCYLQQRGIVGDAYREKHRLNVLESYVSSNDGLGIDRFLTQLGRDFNGDFLSSSDGSVPTWEELNADCFGPIRKFLDAVDLETGQGSFWRYDFSHIPVELISGIYETLLKERQDTLRAYYTPRHLAHLVVQQAFEVTGDPSTASVYDGACGSGILLTTAFRQMLRHAEALKGRKFRLRERISLMRSNVFGNDIDETACWITAFSLYLSLLEGLVPADISLLQSDEGLKLPRLVGPRLNIQKGDSYGDFFSEKNPFAGKRRFDVFLCNPPWRESADAEQPSWEEWCKKQTPAYPVGRRQIAAGFAYRAMQSVHAKGVVVLIMPLNLIIGASQQSIGFRRRLLLDAFVERIVNFADVRRLLFPAAKHPCAVVRARPRPQIEGTIALSDETVEYWTPKTDVSLALGRLALHAIDRKPISAQAIYDKPYVLISSYWGEARDLELLARLQRLGTIRSLITNRRWTSGKGFHAPNQSNPDRALGLLEPLTFLPAECLPIDHPVITQDAQLIRVRDVFNIVASPGGRNGELYRGPRVLFPDGLGKAQSVRAAFTSVPFAFQSSIGGIKGPKADEPLLKFLTAYLRSPLASYLLVMTGYSVIGERPRIAVNDVEAFPFCVPEMHPQPNVADAIVREVAEVIDQLASEPELLLRSHAYASVRMDLDDLVFNYFQLSDSDRMLVRDTVRFVATSIQPSDYARLKTPLLRRASEPAIKRYVDVLTAKLAEWREHCGGEGGLRVRAVVDGKSGFFGAVHVATAGYSDLKQVDSSRSAFQRLLSDFDESMARQLDQTDEHVLFKVPNVMMLADDEFFFVKPLRQRFWMSRTALSDADHIVRTVQAAAWMAGGH